MPFEPPQPSTGGSWSPEAWAASLRVAAAVAAVLENVTPADMDMVTWMSTLSSRDALAETLSSSPLVSHIADILWAGSRQLLQPPPTAAQLTSKFRSDGQGFTLKYSTLSSFNKGLEGLIGSPLPRLLEAMEREHCHSADSTLMWTTGNYGVTTAAFIEFWFVADAEAGITTHGIVSYPTEAKLADASPRRRRTMRTRAAYERERRKINDELAAEGESQMLIEEVLSAALYTGPCFEKYNAVLRGVDGSVPMFAQRFADLCHGNKYTTTSKRVRR
jgi:NLR family CARD domain-containing protein 3